MNFSKLHIKIKDERYSVNRLAQDIGITAVGLKGMLDNEDMKISVYEKLCNALNVSPCYFFNDNGGDTVQEPRARYETIVELYEENRQLRKELMQVKKERRPRTS